jgi:hypothetical protein
MSAIRILRLKIHYAMCNAIALRPVRTDRHLRAHSTASLLEPFKGWKMSAVDIHRQSTALVNSPER